MKKSGNGLSSCGYALRRLISVVLGALFAVNTLGFGATRQSRIPTPRALSSASPLSKSNWIDHLRRGRVWTDVATTELDLLAGPRGPGSFSFNQEVVCNYHTPGRVLGGVTPKFLCQVGSVVYKVKYLPNGPASNREIFAEVAASRLFWALGFGTDRNYPVRILCRGCPASPHDGPTPKERRTGVYKRRARRIGIGVIEVRFDGAPLEGADGDGWKWTELDQYVGTKKPGSDEAPEVRSQVEALKLLQVFVQHGDCKPRQQRMVCPEGSTMPRGGKDSGRVAPQSRGSSCPESYLLVDDLGATFGGAGDLTGASAKMDLAHWATKDVFDLKHYEQTNGQCKGVLDISLSCDGGLENPIISEVGRRFLLDRLYRLSQTQIRDIFRAARVDLLDKGLEREEGLLAWVQAFNAKVQEIAKLPCRDP